MNITDVCIRKPVFAWMLMAATLVFGAVALHRIGVSQFPDVDFPVISVNMTWEGAAPDVVEHDVLEVIEEALTQVEGVRSITSNAYQGGAWVSVELDLNRPVDVALQDVQTRLTQAQARLPTDMDPPIVWKSNPEDQPIMWIGLSGAFAPQLLADTARYRVRERLQTVPGVGQITMGGYLERNIRIWLDATKLDERGLAVDDVMNALHREHIELPAGRLESTGREVNVRVLGETFDLQTLRKLVIRSDAGAPVYLQDVALVEDGFEDVRHLARADGAPSRGIGVRKQRGANAVEVARNVRAAIAEVQKTLPEGMRLQINFDGTQFIEESVHEIELEILLSVVLTALVCWIFLGSISSTFNVVLAIPMSLFGTVAVLYFLGYTLNTFTLLALGLAVGIVVDDAIMVLENIFRHGEMGKDRVVASREGTKEITFAALAATLAVVAIFVPVVFMGGVIGRFFLQFGVALSLAVMLSYVEAITLAPARCAQFLNVDRQRGSRMGRWMDHSFETLSRRYERILPSALQHPGWVVSGATVLFAISVFTLTQLPREFVPSQDQSRLMLRMRAAVGASLEETDKLVRRAEAFIAGRPEIQRTFTMIGAGADVNSGFMYITLVPPGERALTQQQMAQVIRKELSGYAGLTSVVQDLSQAGFTAQRGFPVEFSLRGGDWSKLADLSQKVKEQMKQSGLVVDVDSDYQVGMPELRIQPMRARAADVGVSMKTLATTINALVGGVRVGKYSADGRRVDVRMRLLADQRQRPEDLRLLHVRGRDGTLVPLQSLVTHDEKPALQTITRRDRERAISIYANIAPGHSQSEALTYVQNLSKELPTGYRAVLGGASVTYSDSMRGLLFALVLGIGVAYMVLASQFNSFLHPVTVLTILPLSIAGAAIALTITGKTLNIFTMIGLLLLMGIVKKNSIVLVDYATQIQATGVSATQAMLKAGPIRLRPILMTSVATMMAVLPAALHMGPGAETRGPMAVAVIGGLIVSTALSLLVVPAFYVLADRLKSRVATHDTPMGHSVTT